MTLTMRLLVVSLVLAACGGQAGSPVTTSTVAVEISDEEAQLILDRCLQEWNEYAAANPDLVVEQRTDRIEECYEEAYGAGALAPRALNDEEIADHYLQELQAMQCLQAEGYEIPAPPSLEVYIETFPEPGSRDLSDESFSFWSAHHFVQPHTGVSSGEYARLLEACPPPEVSP